jgi:hypothetical protein
MAHRVNVILDETAWVALQEVPKGERSKLISGAIKSLVEAKRKVMAAGRMDKLRQGLPKVSSREIAQWIREDRNRR